MKGYPVTCMNQEAVRGFFDGWSLYDFVLDRNYMFHEEIYADVRRVLRERVKPGSFSLVDLGCGSARHLARVLAEVRPARYLGVDLSEVALQHAQRNVALIGCEAGFRQADLLDGVGPEVGQFDVVFSGYALHHLSAEGKREFFRRARTALKPGGALLLVDVARDEGDDEARSRDRYCTWIRDEWRPLPEGGLEHILDHIRGHDHPESGSELHAMAAAAGFGRREDISRYRWHGFWVFGNAD